LIHTSNILAVDASCQDYIAGSLANVTAWHMPLQACFASSRGHAFAGSHSNNKINNNNNDNNNDNNNCYYKNEKNIQT
jgi:hypothetical protein